MKVALPGAMCAFCLITVPRCLFAH